MKLHHISKVVGDISQDLKFYQKLGYKIVEGFEKPKVDKEQKVRVSAIKLGKLTIELLEPLTSKSPIFSFQKSGGGLHHICYEVNNLQKTINYISKNSVARQITPITTSVWNNGRKVCFFLKDRTVFELISQE